MIGIDETGIIAIIRSAHRILLQRGLNFLDMPCRRGDFLRHFPVAFQKLFRRRNPHLIRIAVHRFVVQQKSLCITPLPNQCLNLIRLPVIIRIELRRFLVDQIHFIKILPVFSLFSKIPHRLRKCTGKLHRFRNHKRNRLLLRKKLTTIQRKRMQIRLLFLRIILRFSGLLNALVKLMHINMQ